MARLAQATHTAHSSTMNLAQARGQGQPWPEQDGGFSFRRTNMDRIAPRYRRQLGKYIHKEPPGSLVVDTKNHALYVTFENSAQIGHAIAKGRRLGGVGRGAPNTAASSPSGACADLAPGCLAPEPTPGPALVLCAA
jgi:hypothetical protein